MASEGVYTVGRPVGGEGLSNDPVARDWAPEAAVLALPTVVAHHEVMIGGNLDRLGEVAGTAAATGVDVGLIGLLDPVDYRVPGRRRLA